MLIGNRAGWFSADRRVRFRAHRHPTGDRPRAGRHLEAVEHVRTWQAQPVVHILEPRADHVAQVLKLLETLGTAGNLVTDAQLAALALEHGAVLHTADADFLRFRGLRWFNPITGAASRGLPRSKRVGASSGDERHEA